MAIVLHHSTAKGTALNILLGIANHEGDGGAWPSRSTLAKYGRCTERRVKQIVSELAKAGEVRVDYQAGGLADMDDHRRPNRYQVLVRCPDDCDGTTQHRNRERKRVDRRTGETGFPPGGQPASPPPGETGFPQTTPLEPPIEPTGSDQISTTSTRSAPSGGGNEDSATISNITEAPRNGAKRLTQARTQDRQLFQDLVGADRIKSDGSEYTEGTFHADAVYEALRRRKPRPVGWPGKFLEPIHDANPTGGVGDWLLHLGLEAA